MTERQRSEYLCPPEPLAHEQQQLLEELAQVEHQLEALVRYREQLREKIVGKEADDAD